MIAPRAMSAYVFTAVAGGSLGLLAGGVLTQLLSWHWIFFVNLPIGVVAVIAGRLLIPATTGPRAREGVDWLGSVLVTFALDDRRLRDRRGDQPRLGLAGRARLRRVGGRADGAFVALESRVEQPDHAASDPAAAWSGRRAASCAGCS